MTNLVNCDRIVFLPIRFAQKLMEIFGMLRCAKVERLTVGLSPNSNHTPGKYGYWLSFYFGI